MGTFTTLPLSGEVPTATKWDALISECRPIAVRKSADETVNNSAVLQNDDQLVVALAASTTYEIDMVLLYNSNATADFQFGFVLPSGATMLYGLTYWNTSLVAQVDQFSGSSIIAAGGTAGGTAAVAKGNIVTSSAGNLTVRWAQNTANVSDTKVLIGSILVARQLL